MKELIITFIICTTAVVALFILVNQADKYEEGLCENAGGINIDTYRSNNCWKDGNYIKVN